MLRSPSSFHSTCMIGSLCCFRLFEEKGDGVRVKVYNVLCKGGIPREHINITVQQIIEYDIHVFSLSSDKLL